MGAFHHVGDRLELIQTRHALVDIAHHSERWPNRQCIVLVLHNNDLNQVTWEQCVLSGDPKLEGSQVLPDFPFARYVETIGLKGILVDRPQDVAPAWEEALSADGPVLCGAITDPEVPPLPPHIRMDQAEHMAEALVKGDPHRGRIVNQSVKGKVEACGSPRRCRPYAFIWSGTGFYPHYLATAAQAGRSPFAYQSAAGAVMLVEDGGEHRDRRAFAWLLARAIADAGRRQDLADLAAARGVAIDERWIARAVAADRAEALARRLDESP